MTQAEQCASPDCGKPGLFGYKDQSGKLVWYCERHRLGKWWADARRDGSTRQPAFDPLEAWDGD